MNFAFSRIVRMNLLVKFSFIFIAVFAPGMAVVGYFSHKFLHANAREQVHRQAKLMMDTALAARKYTSEHIKPLLPTGDEPVAGTNPPRHAFHKESVPAYSATELFLLLRNGNPDYSDYSYKEAALNPTSPGDRAQGWEEDIINDFRAHPNRKQIWGQRDTPAGSSLYLAQPLVVRDASCLKCHDTRAGAPKGMIDSYSLDGAIGGFGWKLGETIGAQIVSVPVSNPVTIAETAFRKLMVWLVAGGLATLAVLDALLYLAVIRPIKQMAANADAISKGQMEIPELGVDGVTEISLLAAAFNRMHRSLAKAMKLINDK